MEEKAVYKDVYAKIAAMYKEISLIQFEKDQALDGVTWVSEQEILSKIRPLFSKYGVTPYPDMDIITTVSHDKRGRERYNNYLKLVVELYDADSSTGRKISVVHREWEGVPFGATITMAEKYLYKVLFQIETYDDNASNVNKWNSEARENAKKVLDGMTNSTGETGKAVLDTNVKGSDQVDEITNMVNSVATESGLNGKKEEPKVDSTASTGNTENTAPVADENKLGADYRTIKNEGYLIKLVSATDDQSAVKELNKLYELLKGQLEMHQDYLDLKMNFRNVFGVSGAKATNNQFRRYLIEYRIYGSDAMFKLMAADCGNTSEDILKVLFPEGPPVVLTNNDFKETAPNPRANPNITDIPEKIIVEENTIPAGIILNREGWVEFPDQTPGEMRKPLEGIALLKRMNALGVEESHIKWFLNEDIPGLGETYPHDRKSSPLDLLRAGTKAQLEYMLKFILEKHP